MIHTHALELEHGRAARNEAVGLPRYIMRRFPSKFTIKLRSSIRVIQDDGEVYL